MVLRMEGSLGHAVVREVVVVPPLLIRSVLLVPLHMVWTHLRVLRPLHLLLLLRLLLLLLSGLPVVLVVQLCVPFVVRVVQVVEPLGELRRLRVWLLVFFIVTTLCLTTGQLRRDLGKPWIHE